MKPKPLAWHGIHIIPTEACPPDKALLVGPVYKPTGELDLEATLRASLLIEGLNPKGENYGT